MGDMLSQQINQHRQNLAHPRYLYRTRDPVSSLWTGLGKYIISAFAYLTTTPTAM
jgi:hypothetical protein